MALIITGKPKRKKPIIGKAVRPSKQAEVVARDFMLNLARRVKARVDDVAHLFVEPESAHAALAGLLQKYDSAMNRGFAASFANKWAESISEIEKKKLSDMLASSLGVDTLHILDDPIVGEAVKLAQFNAEELIKSFPREYLADVSQAVLNNFLGIPQPEGRTLTEQLFEIHRESKYHARLVARDQTSKMTTALNQVRMQSVGIDEYIWRTAGDGRVVGFPGGYKPSKAHGNHYKMEGTYCRWDDPAVYSDDTGITWKQRTGDMPKTQAGYDINCRCISLPVIRPEKIH
jgi:uncharacterized protein with gpF-like domain